MNTKTKNPLFVVKKDTVFEVDNKMDYWITRLGLKPVIELFKWLLEFVIEFVKDYPSLIMAGEWIEQWTAMIRPYLIDPFETLFQKR